MGTVTDPSFPNQWAPYPSQGAGQAKGRVKAKSASPVDGDASGTAKSQIVLTKEQAAEIYGLRRVTPDLSPKLAEIAGKSALVAEVYSVSPKTIRDIWNRKTWTQVTRQFWTDEETSVHAFEHVKMMLPAYMPGYAPTTELMAVKQKPRGRPPGSKDSRPRKRRNVKGEGEEDSGDGDATTLRELRDEIAEWSSTTRGDMASSLHGSRAQSQPWQRVESGGMSMGPRLGEKRKASEEPKGTDVEWPSVDVLQPSLVSRQQQQQQREQHGFAHPQVPAHHHHHHHLAHQPHEQQQQLLPHASFQSMQQQQPAMLPPQSLPPSSHFEPFIPDIALPQQQQQQQQQDTHNPLLGPPPRLDLGLDECLRAMSTEGESLMKARVTLEQAVQTSPEARVITEAQRPFRIVHVNDSWAMLCGFQRQEVVGQTLNMIQGPATDPNALRDLVARIHAREEARTMLVNYKKGGFPFLNMLQVQPLVDQEGVVTHYMGVLEDVTLKDYLHPLAHYVRDLRASLGYSQ